MNNLEKYILIDNETQKEVNKNSSMQFEIYGLSSHWGGVIFERNVNNPSQVLFHISNGVKIIETHLGEDECFFVKSDDNFYLHYRDCDDYEYSKKPIKLEKSDIIKVIKEYIYLHQPNLMSKTCMGWDRKKGVLHDPNNCNAEVMLDDKNYYYINKCFDKVSIKICKDNDNVELFAQFILNEQMYENALELSLVKKRIYKCLYGKLKDEYITKYQKLKSELEEFVENN